MLDSLVVCDDHGLAVYLLGQLSDALSGVRMVQQNALKVFLTDREDIDMSDCHNTGLHGRVVDEALGPKVASFLQDLGYWRPHFTIAL